MNTGATAMTQKYKLAPIEALDKVAFRLDDMNSLSDKEEIQQDKDCIETIRAALTAQSETGDVFYDQTVQGEKGNCMSACLASLMGIHIDNVPNFFDLSDNNDDWWIELRKWLAGYNLGILTINFHPDYLDRFKGKFIISGESQRGLFHATIWENGKMIHDPHPSKSGIKDPQQVDILYQLNPRTSTCKKCLQVDALMNKAVDRMQSLVPDEISVIGVLVGLRDFSNRPDYCPKVMKAKLSECIDNLQKLYHEPNESSYDKEVFDLGLKVKFLIEQSSKSGAVQYLGICPDEKVLALSEKFSSEEEKVMLDYLNHVKPAETVEGLAEAIEIESINLDYGLYASACTDYKKKYGINSSNVILQAARLWLRKQGE